MSLTDSPPQWCECGSLPDESGVSRVDVACAYRDGMSADTLLLEMQCDTAGAGSEAARLLEQ
jgi:hypothetical protein